jgi:hypothetical protein
MKINSNLIVVISASLAIAVIVGIFAYNYLELYEKPTRKNPSELAQNNHYLAMDRWLEASGHPVRVMKSGDCDDITEATEDVVIVFLSSFDLSGYETLIESIQNGKKITIYTDVINDDLIYDFADAVLEMIRAEAEEEIIEIIEEEVVEGAEEGEEVIVEEIVEEDDYDDYDDYPDFYFVSLGDGILNITDSLYYMQNNNLEDGENAEEAWSYSGALDTDHAGILIFRNADAAAGKMPKPKKAGATFWQLAQETGAAIPIVISMLALIIFGFWMCLAPFGKAKPDHALHGKSIRERFLAEARFYQKHGLLNAYLKYFIKDTEHFHATAKKTSAKELGRYLSAVQSDVESQGKSASEYNNHDTEPSQN